MRLPAFCLAGQPYMNRAIEFEENAALPSLVIFPINGYNKKSEERGSGGYAVLLSIFKVCCRLDFAFINEKRE